MEKIETVVPKVILFITENKVKHIVKASDFIRAYSIENGKVEIVTKVGEFTTLGRIEDLFEAFAMSDKTKNTSFGE